MNDILYKAFFSSLIGLPVSYLINVSVLPILNGLIHSNIWLAGLLLSLPFLLASFTRIYLIDFIYEKYNVNLRPEYLVRKLIKNVMDGTKEIHA